MATDTRIGFFDNWPPWAKLFFSLTVAAIWIGAPMVVAWSHGDGDGVVDYEPIMAVLIAMTTVTITGIFVFMTFRIDRSARDEARREAHETARDAIENLKGGIDEQAQQMIAAASKRVDDAVTAKLGQRTTSVAIGRGIKARITDAVLQECVKNALVLDANAKVITDYAKGTARNLDVKDAERIIHLLKKIVDSWSRLVEKKRKREEKEKRRRRGFWRRIKAFFSRSKRSATE